MSVFFDPAAHTYTVDGVRLPSVTEICRFLSYDRKSDKPWLAQQAADRGTRVHEYTVMLDYGEEPEDIEPDCAGYVAAYRRFLHDYKPEWQGIETVLGSKSLGYAGTCDRYGVISGRRAVLDIKTGSSIHKSLAATQLTGYWTLLGGTKRFFAKDRWCLLLRKDSTYWLENLNDAPELWEHCAAIHQALSKKGMTIR